MKERESPSNTSITYKTEFQTQPLIEKQVFLTLPILSTKITNKDLDQYNRELEKFREEMEEWNSEGEEINMLRGFKKPKEPSLDRESTYSDVNLNMSETIIKNWVAEYDEENDRPVIVMECYTLTNGVAETYNVGLSEQEFKSVLIGLGGVCFSYKEFVK